VDSGDGRVVSSVVDGLLNFGPDVELYHVASIWGQHAATGVEIARECSGYRRIIIDWANYGCHRRGQLSTGILAGGRLGRRVVGRARVGMEPSRARHLSKWSGRGSTQPPIPLGPKVSIYHY